MGWLNQLSLNEKKLIKYGAIIVIVALLWVFVYQPITQSIQYKQRQAFELNKQYTQMQVSQELLKEKKENTSKFHRDNNKPFISWIDEQLEQQQLSQYVARAEPKDNKTLILTFENIVFDELAKWLQTLEQNYQITITEADINLTDKSNGLCNARLTLEE